MALLNRRPLFHLLSAAVIALPLGGSCAMAEVPSGSYLAAQSAAGAGDFDAAATYFTKSLMLDSENPEIMENAVLAFLALGDVPRALVIAQQLEEMGQRSQIGQMALVADLVNKEDFDSVLTRVGNERAVGPLVDGLLRSWSLVGTGDMTAALDSFDAVGEEPGLKGFASYHKALALALVGDFEGADAIFGLPDSGPLRQTRRGAMAHIEILSQLGEGEKALKALTEAFGTHLDPKLGEMKRKLEAGETLGFSHVENARQGMAEVFYTVASALRNEASEDYTLLYARVAQYLRPDHIEAILMTAGLLEQLDQFELATQTYKQVERDDPAFHAAEMGRAEALRKSGKTDAAIEVLESLTKTHAHIPIVHSSLGDILRQQEQFEGAVAAYNASLAAAEAEARDQWFLYYARGISHERLENWEQAEADLRKALELNPDQPQVLNYLGYSLVEKQTKLDEALDMIERAVSARPDSGYIVDSLGWVLYRLGRYEDAVGHMERAAELMAIDPIVNDHLGDVYWAVGRELEARFQWKRALSFVDFGDASQEADPDRIRRKLEVGLDQVLKEEGSPALKRAGD